MEELPVRFWSDHSRVAGWWRTPSAGSGPWPAVVQGPGFFGSKDAAAYLRYHRHLTDAGFGVLVIDYRGFGDSEGPHGRFSPCDQVEDLVNAVTYLETRDDVDPFRIGAFGTGATGGGNVVLLCAADCRVRAGVAQFPIADGEEWLRGMRSDGEWSEFLRRLDRDRRLRVATGGGERVDPHHEVMIAPAERASRGFKKEVRSRIPREVSLAAADRLLRYRPVDIAHTVSTPILLVAVEGDEATPETHAVALRDRLTGPAELLLLTGTSHYASYEDRAHVVVPRIVEWFRGHLDVPPPDRGPSR